MRKYNNMIKKENNVDFFIQQQTASITEAKL